MRHLGDQREHTLCTADMLVLSLSKSQATLGQSKLIPQLPPFSKITIMSFPLLFEVQDLQIKRSIIFVSHSEGMGSSLNIFFMHISFINSLFS